MPIKNIELRNKIGVRSKNGMVASQFPIKLKLVQAIFLKRYHSEKETSA